MNTKTVAANEVPKLWEILACIKNLANIPIIMWNNLNLQCPVEDVCTYSSEDKAVLHLTELVSLLTSSAEVLTKDHPIWAEIKIFQNVQAKYRRILHCDKCLLLLQKVGTCLRKVVLLNLSKIYLDLAEHFLKGVQDQNSSTQLPSRQQLEYALLRTQSASKLLCEALRYSKEAFCYLIQKLKVGHLVLHLMMATSVTARVNILFKGILIQLFDIYRNLYSWHQKLKSGSFKWPKTLELPEDLEAWLNPEVSEVLKPKPMSEDQQNMMLNFFQREKNGKVSNEETDTANEDENDCVIISEINQLDNSSDSDTGEVVERESINRVVDVTEKEIPKCDQLTQSQKILLERINNAMDLKTLMVIWNNIDVNSQVLLPKLKPSKIRLIDKLFLLAEKKIKRLKVSPLSIHVKHIKMMAITKLTATKLMKHLGLTDDESDTLDSLSSCANQSVEDLKPVKTFKKLKALYNSLYQILQTSQQYDKCHALKKIYRSRKADIKLLIKNGEKMCAKKLIFCTSKTHGHLGGGDIIYRLRLNIVPWYQKGMGIKLFIEFWMLLVKYHPHQDRDLDESPTIGEEKFFFILSSSKYDTTPHFFLHVEFTQIILSSLCQNLVLSYYKSQVVEES
ncbi:DUF4477 domain-containing protein [Trichonephila clavata]|uniref:DUF4477 domain-containing protein n=1 Tax=Trichonephila clavata TaxID=2740835 RepID=A0A8X6GJ32_TRICU|nr:DUF4477 domain-containing protein [Trichonephila clavata]